MGASVRAVGSFEPKRVLITVKTYPVPSWKTIESSCTAGITDDGRWIRLYPIPHRLLEGEQQFQKYQWIQVRAAKSADPRPESYQPDIDSIRTEGKPIPSDGKWQQRKAIVSPLASPSLCALKRLHDKMGASIGLFRPRRILSFEIEREENEEWTSEELAKLRREDMFLGRPTRPLEKVPFRFYYRFECDDPECTGHRLSCHDWEIVQLYRRCRTDYGRGWEARLRRRYERDMIELCDTHFYVGTVLAHPDSWIIVGMFYPRK